uniref:Uncharacterized protein n=1 Tax=Tortanus dextrilobatus TaxID=207953 RepID=A0A0U2VDW6_9MAXI|nr:hypothetical protein [Tortanus dextrilobatus]
MLVNALTKVNAVSRAMVPSRAMSSTKMPKYSSVAGIGMGYAIPILGFFGVLMGACFAISPFQNRDKSTKIHTEKYQS